MQLPPILENIQADTQALGFSMGSDSLTGSLLRSLAASKPGGRLLELGTGTGYATAWLLDGMDESATLVSVDNDPDAVSVAQKHLGNDPRLTLCTEDGLTFLKRTQSERFDLIFADTWPGKLEHPELALNLLKPGGFYIVDDANDRTHLPANVPGISPDVLAKIPEQWRDLTTLLEERETLTVTELSWSTGLIIATRRSE